mgnify:CR=1 FL=1
MSEAQAKKCYLEHHVIVCDFCDMVFNKDDDIEHFKKVHKPSIDLENHIRDILEAPFVGTISEKELQKRLRKYYTKLALSSRKEEINKLHVKVKNEIKKKKEEQVQELIRMYSKKSTTKIIEPEKKGEILKELLQQ